MGRMRRFAWAFGLIIGTAVVLAGCGGGNNAGTPAKSPAAQPAADPTVTVTETEFSITLSQSTFTPATYTFSVTNQGTVPHNLTIEGPGVAQTATPTLQPGQSGDVTVTLQAGTYELWCSVDAHKDRGMDLMITVA